jgi:fumarylacetoacetate (FAA) hydrolase family protein
MSEAKPSGDMSTKQTDNHGIPLSDEAAAAVAAVLHLLRLFSAELVLFRGLDIQRLEKAMREKISEFTNPIANQEAKEAGLNFARSLVDRILVQVRAQAELKTSLAGKSASEGSPPASTPASSLLH